jgi:hypothetical protein
MQDPGISCGNWVSRNTQLLLRFKFCAVSSDYMTARSTCWTFRPLAMSEKIRTAGEICFKVENKEHISYTEKLHILKCTNMATVRNTDTVSDKLKVFVVYCNTIITIMLWTKELSYGLPHQHHADWRIWIKKSITCCVQKYLFVYRKIFQAVTNFKPWLGFPRWLPNINFTNP